MDVDETKSQFEWVTLAMEGDRPALESLILFHYDRLAARISRKLPVSLRRTVAVEDILQQTFTAAFLGIRSFCPEGRGAFFRWLATIAEHRLKDAIRGQRAAKRGGGKIEFHADAGVESFDELIDLMEGPNRTPSQSTARLEAANAVHVALASLGEDCREAIQLRYIQGLCLADAAEALNKTPRSVRDLCYRGLKELRVVLGGSSQYFSSPNGS